MNIGLVEVVGGCVERAFRQPPIDGLEPRGIAVDAPRTGNGIERDAERVNRNEPIGVVRPLHISVRADSPVAPGRSARLLRLALDVADRVCGRRRRRRIGGRGPGEAEPADEPGTDEEHEQSKPGGSLRVAHGGSPWRGYAGRSSHIGHQSGSRGNSCDASLSATWVDGSIRPAATASCGSPCPSTSRASSSDVSRK
jgi:hypothetical protein